MTARSALIGHGITLELVEGNLADAKEDTIVNSTGDGIYLHVSVAKALLDKAGPELEAACSKLEGLKIGEVKATPGFKIPCKQILHCNSNTWKKEEKNKKELKQIIILCLEKAAQHSHQSIALPTIGMGVKQYPAEVVAECIIAAVREYSLKNPSSSLKLVKLFLFKPATTSSQRQIFYDCLRMIQYKVSSSGVLTAGAVKVSMVKGNLPEVTASIIVNSTGTQMSLSGGKVSLALLNKAGKTLQEECDKLKPLLSGQVVMTDGFGLPCDKVIHVCCPMNWETGKSEKVLGGLILQCLKMASDESASSIAFPVIGTGLLKYPPELVVLCLFQAVTEFSKKYPTSSLKKILLVAYIQNDSTISKIQSYFGVTLAVHQNNGDDAGDGGQTVERPIVSSETKFQRKVISDLPASWEKPLNCYMEFPVRQSTTEFKDLERDFRKTLNLTNRQVVIIEAKRIQNPSTYFLFDCQRTNIAAKLSKQEHEVETAPLWHGTSEANVDKIARTNFDRGLSGAVGYNLLGANCCYFSTTSEYSNGFAQANSKGEKFMFLVRVVTGKYCKGDGTYKQLPYKNKTEQYDSVVNDVSNPTMFAVFHDASAYPEYVIKYKFVASASRSSETPKAPQTTSDDSCKIL